MDTFAEPKLGNLVRFANRVPAESASAFFVDRQLGRRESLEPLVGNRFPADDRAAERSRCQALLGSSDRRQLFAEILGSPFVELVLEEIRGQVRRVELVGRLTVVRMTEAAELVRDPAPLGGQQLARMFVVHAASLRGRSPCRYRPRRRPGCGSRASSLAAGLPRPCVARRPPR